MIVYGHMSTPRTPITAIAFDYGGVLAHHIDDTAIAHMAAAAGAPLETFRTALWNLRPQYDADEIDAFSYWHAVLQACRDQSGSSLPTDSGPPVAGTPDEAQLVVDRETRSTVDLLDRLDSLGWSRMNIPMFRWEHELRRHGYRTLIISNMATHAYDILIRRQLWAACFEYIVVSGQIGKNKPDPAMFETAVTDLKLEPQSVLFVDDRQDNVDAAAGVGLHALKFTDAPSLARDLEQSDFGLPTEGLQGTQTP